jgi:hypothetical protein
MFTAGLWTNPVTDNEPLNEVYILVLFIRQRSHVISWTQTHKLDYFQAEYIEHVVVISSGFVGI